jgi:hypothetical protein
MPPSRRFAVTGECRWELWNAAPVAADLTMQDIEGWLDANVLALTHLPASPLDPLETPRFSQRFAPVCDC